MPSSFLVTGGCGFIGSHLVEFLVGAGHSVTVIDDLSSGYMCNLDSVEGGCHVHVSRIEDCDLKVLGDFDAVFHLAAQASVPYSVDNFYHSSATNLLGSIKIIEYCSIRGIPLVYASSSAVYGNLPYGEEGAGTDLLTPYATDKLVSEIYCDMASKLYQLRSYGLRFFNVYGPRQDPSSPYSGVISVFLDRLLREQPLTINGGHQTRDFIYVGDVVSGIFMAYDYLRRNPVATCSNLLTGKSISINRLAEMLMQLAGVNVALHYRELPKGDPEASLGSTAKMEELLQISQTLPLEAGLRITLNWLKARDEKS